MPEKLRLIADCIEQGKTVQFSNAGDWKNCNYVPSSDGTISIESGTNYRAKPDKPDKPRIGTVKSWGDYNYDAVEITEEVKKALQDANIDYG